MKKLLHILLLFIIWIPGVAQVYNMGNLGTITNACGGLFYDSQGPNAQYLNNEFSTVTFCAPAGQAITFTFTDFRLEAGFDFLDVYNGPSTASPLLGSYTGNLGPGVISSTIGGCLTFQFFSDGVTRRRGWEAAISCGDLPPPTNNGDTCPNSTPFCTGTTYTFNNNINVPSLGAINCLGSSPNPVWYYFEIENPGDLTIDIAQYDVFDFPIDIDFLLWGPFTSLPDGCTQIQNSTAPVVDCSFSGSAFEQAVITGAQAGEVYILLLTNFENDQGYITFTSSSSSTATTNCDILCSITALSATPTACDPTSNTYEVSGELTVTNPPESGILTFTSSCGGTTTVSAPFGSQISYTISGINAAGGSCNVVASFSADPSCTITESYTAPAACATVSLNCPDYANASTSPTTACSNQTYYLDVANTACAGQIFLTVEGNYGSLYQDEISWSLTSITTGNVIASGDYFADGQSFTLNLPAIDPVAQGTIFRLDVFDIWGDGFDGTGGFVQVKQGGVVLGITLDATLFGNIYTIFGANISISPATITVTTPAGNVVQTVQNCNDFRVPISIENPNFCNTINATLPWTVTCNSTGATLASGSNTLTVYPTLPTSSNDVVSIQYNTSTCDWEVSGNNDCDAGDIGTIFTISPNPASLTNTACTGGTQTFDLTYIGVGGGPNCCSTGGTLIPIQINDPYAFGSFVANDSPFGGIDNAAYLNIPPNTVGGNATSLQLDLNMTGFCMDPAGPNLGADLSYWVTVLVDGQIVSDINTIDPGPASYSQTINLADIPGGFNSSMDIEVYVYPNIFASPNGLIDQTFNSSASCASLGNGIWTASSITANLAVTFEEFEPTAASCLYPTNAAFSCCAPTIISNASSTICSVGSTAAVTTWQNAVAAANATCVVYSSVLPVAGTTLPNNSLPNGINGTGSPIIQTVSAYAYCDADGSSTINAGDTYTLISTYTLTVNPNVSAGSNGSITICTTGSSVNLFSLLGGTPANTGTWSGPSALSGGNLGTFNPTINTAGVYTYTVAGTSPCPNATATVTVTFNTAPSASITYTGSPFCTNQVGTQTVSLSGTTGGTFSSAPSGLSINPSTGTITASTSTPGTYTITYTIASAGGCAAFTASTTVVITSAPSAPGLTPALPCEGEIIDFTASGGSWYSFTVNGVELQAPSADNTYTSEILTAGDEVCVQSYPVPPFVFNGQISEPEWGNPLSISAGGPTSSFGALNNLDALHLKNMSGNLYGALAGQTESGSNNRFLLFIDCIPGGFNSLSGWFNRTNAPYWSMENLSNGINFDPGFNPDYILAMNQAFGLGFFDLYNMQTNNNLFLGQTGTSEPLGYQNNGGSGNFTQGYEFAISLDKLGNPTGSIQVFAMLVNDPGSGNPTFVSNQFLTPAGPAENSYGNSAIFFGSAQPNPISYALSADCSNETCVTVTSPITPTFSTFADVCEGGTVPTLPTTSNNSITGTWSPSTVSNTASGSYTFTPTAGLCADPITVNITVTPRITPTFNPVAAICSGDALSALPTTSTNGINGTWSPSLNNTATTLYTFTPSGGQCASTTTLTITVNPIVTPTFSSVAAICAGDALSALPTTSTNGINGTWSPSLNNTATTVYTFTPSGGQCASTTTLTITVNPIVTPTFNAIADFCFGTTSPLLPGTSLNGISGTWNPNVISNTASGNYTFTPNAGVCADQVTITVNVTPRTVPTFSVIPPFCEGIVAPSLPSTSNNGISGTWSPSLISNTAGNTYNFTPNAGQCADTGSVTTTVLPNPTTTPIYHD